LSEMENAQGTESTSAVEGQGRWEMVVKRLGHYVDTYANFVDALFADAFAKTGLFVGAKPLRSISFSLFILILCCMGFMNFYSENRNDKLWVPQDTQGQDDKKLYESFFQGSRMQFALLEAKESDTMLSKTLLQDAMTIYEQIHALSVIVDGEAESLSSLCIKDYRNGDPCLVNSVLDNWMYNSSALGSENNDTTILTTINAANEEEDLKNVLGHMQTSNGDITSAQAAMIFFFIEDNRKVVNGEYVDPQAEDWEEAYLDFLEDPSRYGFSFPDINIYRFARRSVGDEFGDAIQGDISLLLIAYMVLLVYVAFNLGQTGQKCVRMRASLSVIVLITVGISIAASTGLCSGFGLMYTPLHSVLPFVLLGIGVDDSFVIADSFDAIHHKTPVPERTSRALSHAGVSITITSMTDFAAFAISSTTSLPALSSFCVYAAFGVLFLYFFQILFFTAFLAIDAMRQNANRPDCLCCITVTLDDNTSVSSTTVSPKVKEVEMVSNEDVGVPSVVVDDQTVSPVDSTANEGEEVEIGVLQHFLQNTYGPFLMNPIVKCAVILMFAGLLAFSIIGASQLRVESADRSFIPDGSYILDTLDASDKYFGENGLNIEIVTHNFDHFEKQNVLADIQERLAEYSGRSPYLEDPYGPTYDSWYNSYIEWLNVTGSTVSVDSSGRPTDRSEFYDSLHDFLQGPQGRKYNSSVIRNAAGTNIEASKVKIQQKTLAKYSQGRLQVDAKKSVEAMDDFRHICNNFEGTSFPWTPSYIGIESLKSIQEELSTSVSLSLVVVFLIVLLLIGSPTTSVLITICVVNTVIGLLGVMFYWDLVIDGVGVINLVLAIGLAVDYSAHIGHAFMLYPGTPNARAVHAVGNIGAAVLNGALSTFLAIMLLSVSESYVFRVLFKQFFATVILGAAHGLILLPVLLSLLGPEPFSRSEQSHVYVKPPLVEESSKAESEHEQPEDEVKSAIVEPSSQSMVTSEQHDNGEEIL